MGAGGLGVCTECRLSMNTFLDSQSPPRTPARSLTTSYHHSTNHATCVYQERKSFRPTPAATVLTQPEG
jgi:hypothetical protein